MDAHLAWLRDQGKDPSLKNFVKDYLKNKMDLKYAEEGLKEYPADPSSRKEVDYFRKLHGISG